MKTDANVAREPSQIMVVSSYHCKNDVNNDTGHWAYKQLKNNLKHF